MSLESMLAAAWRELPSGVQDRYGEPAAFGPVLAAGLRVMADEVGNGPAFPIPPSVVSQLIRERADDLDGAADG